MYLALNWFPLLSSLRWRHNGRDGVSNHQPHDCLLSRFVRRRSKKHQSPASLALVRGIHRAPLNSPHIWSVTRKLFLFDDVIMIASHWIGICHFKSAHTFHYIDPNKYHGASTHRELGCLFKSLCMATNPKNIKVPRQLSRCEANPLVTGGFPSRRITNGESVCIS